MKFSCSSNRFVFHLLPNSHLNPVWLRDWRKNLNDVNASKKEIRLILARASRYADLEKLSQELLSPPLALNVPAQKGCLKSSGSLGHLEPESALLLSAYLTESGNLPIRIQNPTNRNLSHSFHFLDKQHDLGKLRPFEIKTIIIPLQQKHL